MTLSFPELLASLSDLDGQTVEVRGRLAATLDEAYLIDPETPFERWIDQRVLLDFPRLPDVMLASVSPRVGSELAYFEYAVVRGVVKRGGSDGIVATLGDLDLIVVEQRGKRYPVVGTDIDIG
jgi:hypothetical protein